MEGGVVKPWPALLAALLLTGCGGGVAAPPPTLIATDVPGEPLAFMNGEGGWVLSRIPPRFPYSVTIGPTFDVMSGAGGSTPFGCGITSRQGGYFSGPRGRLTCVSRQRDGQLRLAVLGNGQVSRVYDAAPVRDQFQVVAQASGRAGVTITTVSSTGDLIDSIALDRRWSPDQAVLLHTGRLALLHRTDGRCLWTVLERAADAYVVVSEAPADHAYHCHASSQGAGLFRDQISGQAYVRFRQPTSNALYRIDDNGQATPATRLTPDLARDMTSTDGADANLLTALNGSIYFRLSTEAGPIAGRYDTASGRTTTMPLTSPSGHWNDAARLTGFMLGEHGDTIRMALMQPRSGETVLRPMTTD